MLGFCLRCLTSDWKSGSSWSGPVIASLCLDPFFTLTAVVEKLYSVINWVKHCLVDECYQILYNGYNPLDRDCFIYWEVLSILLVGRASCLNSKIVSMCEGCFFGGEGELGVAVSCSGKRVTLGFHVGLSACVQIHKFTVLPFFLSRASLPKGKWNL